ncbi:uncharacterized protein TRIADDRAFT_59816 [Trichoplax adhaerens]|uniref:Uncharacterized protein n=1 Tax=Trichoplax adhaerens TaxID=10228 RepID=B3S6I4_TRIAD|nr:hypothetical protein TRIADDRAFT_59816 [Trichoplax adhaerens]EDV21765.1 hypothetical protein TRIADDRAFT_59816 [Trichoplax adhaerens]|eukprot:XP_002115913.1 hypothetical protein TRIADDRAFT_59816 [Trichoplax adhaerens]
MRDVNLGCATYENLTQELEKRYLNSHGAVIYDHAHTKWNYRCNHPEVIEAMYALGSMYEKEMRLDEAIQCYKDAIQRQIKIKSTTQKLLLVRGLLGFGSVLSTQKNLLESKRVIFRALEVATDFLGSDHPYVTSILSVFGQLSYKQNSYREALTFYIEDLAVTCKKFGIIHPRTAGILNNIALAYADLQKDSAEAIYSVVLSILGDYYGDTPNIHAAIARFNLACFYQSTNMHQRAEYQFRTAANLFDTLLGSSHPHTEEAMQLYQDSCAI